MNYFQNIAEINVFLKQFPFLSDIVGDFDQKESFVTINVSEFKPDNLFFKGNSAVVELKPMEDSDAKNLKGKFKLVDKFYLFAENGYFIGEVFWDNYNGLLKDALKSFNFDLVHTLVSVVYSESIDDGNNSKITSVDVYTLPKNGLETVFDNINMLENITLNYDDFVESILNQDGNYRDLVKPFSDIVSSFVLNIYKSKLESVVNKRIEYRQDGFGALDNGLILLAYFKDENLLIRISNNNAKIIFIKKLSNDSTKFGIELLRGKLPDLELLLLEVIGYLSSLGDDLEKQLKHSVKIKAYIIS